MSLAGGLLCLCEHRRPSFAAGGFGSSSCDRTSACSAGKSSGSSCSLRSFSAFRFFGMILNMDEFRVMDLKPSLAVTIDPFFSSTTRGSGLKGLVNLLVFGCLTSTVSPGLISLGFVPSLESAYAFIFDFCSASLSVIVFRVWCRVFCIANGAGDTSGRIFLSFLPFSASFGDIFVVVCGVARYCLRNLYSSCFQFLPSTTAVRTHFSRFSMKRSASPLALDQRG